MNVYFPFLSLGAGTVYIEIFIVFFLGLVLGSFSSALIYRIPKRIPWAFLPSKKGGEIGAYRSACPSCRHSLQMRDLFPVFSWLWLRGHCRYCGASISGMYPLSELLCVLTAFGFYAIYDLSFYGLVYVALAPFLVALLFIDLRHMILPNILILCGLVLGVCKLGMLVFSDMDMADILLVEFLGGAVAFGLLSWLIGFIMTKILRRESLGFGDVKFFMMAGLWLGVSALPYFLMLSGVLGVVFAGAWMFFKKESAFPFGPALIVAFYILSLEGGSHFL